MRRRIMTALIFTVLAVFCSVSSEAAYTTKLTLVINRSAPVKVSEDKISADGTFHGTVDSRKTFTDSHGRRTSETHTLFTNRAGIIMMSADVRIASMSDDYKALSGEKFAETLSVDSVIELYDSAYDSYTYSLDVKGLPEWLKVSGVIVSRDSIGVGVNEYHHEFTVYGTPETSYVMAGARFTALIYVSGDYPALLAKGSKDVRFSAGNVPKPPDPPETETNPPDISPDISPDVVPKSTQIDTNDFMPTDSGNGPISLADILRNMTPEEKSAVTTLKVNGNIKDLTGLEEFTNLERLDLTEALSLETVDLRGNSSVKSVDVSGNTAVKSLTLTGSKVETLDASGCESLVEVNVAGCESLKSLNVKNTPITSLNAEGCKGLEVLDCSECRLETLNLSGCESLNVLDCHDNRLNKLDAYTFAKLDELICYNQNIAGVKVGREFSFLEFFGNVSASDNEANDSGVENVINIRAWDSSGNEITARYDIDTRIAIFGGVPAKIAYDYITGFNGVNMDVTVFADGEEAVKGIRNESSGCKAVSIIPIFAFALVVTVIVRMRKRE